MKGRILGFNETDGSGAISAEDGSRHKFTRADWRSDRPPAAGMSVDFESEGGIAQEVYPVTGAAKAAISNMNVDLSGLSSLSSGGEGEKVTALFTRSLATPLALVVIIAFFLSAISSPVESASLMDLGKLADVIAEIGDDDAGGSGAMLMLRFIAPLSALWLLFAAFTGKPEKLPMLVTGAGAILAAIIVFLFKASLLSAAPELMRESLSANISIGLGTWLMLLAGGALIAAALGVIRNPLAKG